MWSVSGLLCAAGGLAAGLLGLLLYAILDRRLKVSPCIKRAAEIGFGDNNIREGFSEKKVAKDQEERPFDCIVIGSGIGGLSTASLLARRGKRVLMLEQHDVIGGCTHSFEEKGYEFDTGIHYIGGEVGDSRSVLGFLFDLLTVGRLRWTKISGAFDVARISNILRDQGLSEGSALDLELKVSSAETLQRDLLARYPEERDALDSFFRLCRWGEFVFPLYAVGLTKNEDLIGALTWCYGNSGLPPKEGAFIMSAIMVSHYDKGAFYPTGGTAEIARSMVPIILAAGGKAYVRAPVSSVVLSGDGCQALGVVVRDMTILAPCVISAAGALCTYTRLIPTAVTSTPAATVRSVITPTHLHRRGLGGDGLVGPSCSMFSVFVGLRGNPCDLKLPAHNTWLFPHWRHDNAVRQYRESVDGDIPYLPLLFVSFSSAKDGTWTDRHPDKSVVELLTIADYDSFVTHDKKTGSRSQSKPGTRGITYEEYKQTLVSRIMDVFLAEFPHLSSCVDVVVGASPLTNNYYIGATSGEVYGLEQSVTRFTAARNFLQPRQPIRSLYLSGQDAMSNGVAGALFGGLSCAVAVDPSVLVDVAASYIAAI